MWVGVYAGYTTLIFERHVCAIGLIPDAGNYQIFPPKRDGHNAVFTNNFHPLQEKEKKN